MDALARLGYNRENMFSPLPMITKNIQALTSLVDENYNNQMKWQASQAQIKETLARAGNIDSQTAYNNQSLQARLKALDLENIINDNRAKVSNATIEDQIQKAKIATKQDQENLRHSENYNPIIEEEGHQKLSQAQILTEDMKSQQQRDRAALDELPMALADIPTDPSDPDFEDKLVTFYKNHPAAATNPKTSAMINLRMQAIENARNQLSSVQEANNNAKTIMAMKATGDLPGSTDVDALKKNPVLAHQTIVNGNVTATQRRISEILSAIGPTPPPELQRQVGELQNAQNRLSTILGAPDGTNQIISGAWSQFFDTNGRLNPGLEADIAGIQTYAQERVKQGLAKPMSTTISVKGIEPVNPSEIRVENVPAGREAEVTRQMQEALKSPEQRAQEAAGVQANKQVQLTSDVAKLYQSDSKLMDMAKEAARTGDWSKVTEEIRKRLPQPEAKPGTTQTGRAGTEDQLATSNNDYKFPSGAPDVMGIDRNVWANVMSEEGREFGKDGSHDSVFGLWADAPGVESAAYRAVREHGPDSLPAYNAVTSAWTQAFLSQSRPWDLNSPGLQEMVIADSQHVGGEAARRIIERMGGYPAVNAMDPAEAIRRYSELRLPIWERTNNAARVTREMHWALTHDRQLASTQEQLGAPQASAIAPQEGNRRMVPEGSAIRLVSYQPGVEGGLGEDQRYGLQSQNAPRPRLVTTDPTTVDFGDYSFDVAGTFGRHDDGTIDKSESGKGFYTNPATGKPYDVRDSKLVGARIPITDLEQVMGLDAADRKSVTSSEIARGEYQVLVATPDGTVVQMPIVDVNTDQNARGLELTYGASKLFQTRGARQLGYKIVNRNGETIAPTYGVKPSEIKGRQTYISPV